MKIYFVSRSVLQIVLVHYSPIEKNVFLYLYNWPELNEGSDDNLVNETIIFIFSNKPIHQNVSNISLHQLFKDTNIKPLYYKLFAQRFYKYTKKNWPISAMKVMTVSMLWPG